MGKFGLIVSGIFMGLCVWGASAYSTAKQQKAKTFAQIELRKARVAEIKGTPAYAALLEQGSEICPGQNDQVVWVCGATLRMSFESRDLRSYNRQRCSSPEAPRFVGSFTLPEVVSFEAETEGRLVSPGGNSAMRDGTYHNSWFNSMIRIDEDGRLRACSRGESRCRSLGVAGNTEVPTGYISKSVPDELADDLPDLSTANIRHSLDFDAFLNLDERPVAYRAFGYEDGEESCKFIVLHPEHGYQISHTMPCTERSNWRADLRAIIADLSQRTISYQRASCAMPPINARITPSLHSADIDSQQAMRDWAVARDLAPGQ